MAYLIFYSLVFFIVILSKRWKNNFLYFILSALIVSFSAFRYETGFDWPIYDKYLNDLLPIVYFPVFELFKQLFIYSEADKIYFYFWVSIIGNVFILLAASKYFKYYRFVFVLFYVLWTDFYLIHSFSILRQFICLGFILYAFSRKVEGQSYWFALLLALLTHHSAFLFLFFIFAFYWLKHIRQLHIWFMFIVFSLLFLFNISIVNVAAKLILLTFNMSYLEMYMKDTFNASIPLKVVIIFTYVFILYFSMDIFKSKLISENEYYFCMIYVFLSIVFYSFPTVTTRVNLFFVFPVIKVVMFSLRRVVFLQRVFITGGVVMILAYSNYRFYLSPLNVTYYPYQTWLIENDVEKSTGMKRTQEVYDQLYKLGVF
ncbi:EpsG family protein [Vibrio parahaemolyticus]|uniref:EpsG family protein n=1 Tax=Vibrio parahaemolyticus TaxID=670 RepID=UPI0006A6E21F|nr:EpsG family protein [Vibrio parahaemolyticus]EGR0211445.1 hypothetical protein [Vibrio parahaemolyticus]KON62299.1 hypothetical protein ACX11_02895 [Vibrio parahaemolyticus]